MFTRLPATASAFSINLTKDCESTERWNNWILIIYVADVLVRSSTNCSAGNITVSGVKIGAENQGYFVIWQAYLLPLKPWTTYIRKLLYSVVVAGKMSHKQKKLTFLFCLDDKELKKLRTNFVFPI